jgi:AcrR family transcriptional regulator
MPATPRLDPAATPRYQAKRGQILEVASLLINDRGVKGLSLGEVAERVGLSNTSITYYFKRKDVLAAACFECALDLFDAQISEAAAQPDTDSRIVRFVDLSFAALADAAHGTARPIVRLSDLRANDDPMRAELVRRYFTIFRKARGFFDLAEGAGEEDRLLRLMRTHVLLENMHALPGWLDRYAEEEHDRVRARMIELMRRGLVRGGPIAVPAPLPLAPQEPDAVRDRFLGAATRLVNERGYRGASVERIAAALDVTKGSFYHHLDAKDDLVLACFRRSLATITRAQDLALAGDGDRLGQLALALSTLIEVQLSDRTPLLRTTALSALPIEFRREVMDRTNQAARRFAGILIDGVSEGSIAPIDPLVAGQMLLAALNVAYELRDAARRVPADRAIALYASTLLDGLLSQP